MPVSLLLLYTAFWSVRREARWSLYCVLVACIGAACFFAFKLYRMYKEKEGAYRLVYKSLTVFCRRLDPKLWVGLTMSSLTAALSLTLLIATFIFAVRCLRNFGKGLKPHRESIWPDR